MLKVIDKEYLISALKDFNEKVLSKIYARISKNQSVLDKLDESDGTLTFNGNKIGLKGDPGQDGIDGKSAYEIAVDNGFSGNEAAWITSLKGEKGNKGDKGDSGSNGNDGAAGENGASAYEIAVKNGFSGTEAEWLVSLKGEQGKPGTSGQKGDKGENGTDGISVIKVAQTTTSPNDDGINVITVTLSNGQTFDFNIKNGSKGSTGAKGDKGDPGQSVNVSDIKPETIGAATSVHLHGSMKTITFSSTEPTSVADGEIVMVYEE